jgi:glucose dehydrogenase
MFRAFDSMTGREIWTVEPGFNVGGTAVSYRGTNGKQYVVISGPKVIAYALP